jgi:ankyrin repeat protein
MDPSSQNLPGWFFIASLSRSENDLDINFACSDCYPVHPRTAHRLENSQDACSQLLLLQHHLMMHGDTENWQQKHADLSLKVAERASATFKSFVSNKTAEYAEEIGVYHPDYLSLILSGPTEDLKDCLERSRLHLYMDNEGCDPLFEMLRLDHDILKFKDKQDILGRTALLIACRYEWDDAVEILLEQQADPGLATVYGSLPLHYAAVMGSIGICEQLLAHKTRFDMKARDRLGKTALNWAKEMGEQDVVELLSAEYAAADREEEMRRSSEVEAALRGLKELARDSEARADHHNAQRPYFPHS